MRMRVNVKITVDVLGVKLKVLGLKYFRNKCMI